MRREIQDIERVIDRAIQAQSQAGKISGDQDVYLDSVALNLHGFYCGLERLFKLLARDIDGKIPQDKNWHRSLLNQMSQDLDKTRPAVIGKDSALALDEFRRFRHLVRNVYTMSLSPDKMSGLMSTLPEMWSRLRDEILAFVDFLEDLDKTILNE